MAAGRNAPCSCGSGRKYKHCCLAAEKRAAGALRFDEAVGNRIQGWAAETFGEEIGVALDEYAGFDRTMHDDDDRRSSPPGSTTIVSCRAGRPRRSATPLASTCPLRSGRRRRGSPPPGSACIACSRSTPGSWIALEDVISGARTRVRSANVSRDAVRWDILLGRVMAGDPESLWGPVRLFAPDEEPELLAELRRLAGVDGAGARADLEAALREHGLDLIRFRPPSREHGAQLLHPGGRPDGAC